MFQKLLKQHNSYYLTNKTTWCPRGEISSETINKVFNFAYKMSFGIGQHRDHRSGGVYERKKGEIFIDCFQGKLSEFALVIDASKNNLHLVLPDTETWGLGKWDSTDTSYKDMKINIKSTKYYGNLLLLEAKDWDCNGSYLPNRKTGDDIYDYFVMIRIKPDGSYIMKSNRLLYSNCIEEKFLKGIILGQKWEYDIPGFVSRSDIIYIINNEFVLPQNASLNGLTQIDANNYYIQSGDMKKIETLYKNLF